MQKRTEFIRVNNTLIAEASSLGWAVGERPEQFTMQWKSGEEVEYKLGDTFVREGEQLSWDYWPEGEGFKVTVFND